MSWSTSHLLSLFLATCCRTESDLETMYHPPDLALGQAESVPHGYTPIT